MSISAHMMQRAFSTAARDIEILQQEPLLVSVERLTLDQVLEPEYQILENDPAYQGCEITTDKALEEFRSMCVEAHTAHTTSADDIKDARNNLSNALQSIIETIQAQNDEIFELNHDNLYILSNSGETIRDTATIHREYMHNPHVADALEQTAINIESAHARHWTPAIQEISAGIESIDIETDAANNDLAADVA